MAKERKMNEAERRAHAAGFTIGERSPKVGTKAHASKKVAEHHHKKMSESTKDKYPKR